VKKATKLRDPGFPDRLTKAMNQCGIFTRTELANRLTSSGHPITDEALAAYFSRRTLPRADILIGIHKLLKVSIDWLLTGQEPPKPTISQLKQIVGEMIETQGAQISEIDAFTLEIDRLLSRLKSLDSKQQVLRMIKGYVELEERGE